MQQIPMIINESNLSIAWGRTLLRILDHSGKELTPLIVTLTKPKANHADFEVASVRAALDSHLADRGRYDVRTVAWTIFPSNLWQRSRSDRERLFRMYRDAYPRYMALNRVQNGRGLYFGRLIDFEGSPCDGNQLEWIISSYTKRRGVRRSMLQASVFDPARDHVPQAQLGFPCLQHVQFAPVGATLTVNAFYATQQLFDKAYGNWLGLCELGSFMGSQMGLEFSQLNCFIGVEKLERTTKRALQPLADVVRGAILDSGQ